LSEEQATRLYKKFLTSPRFSAMSVERPEFPLDLLGEPADPSLSTKTGARTVLMEPSDQPLHRVIESHCVKIDLTAHRAFRGQASLELTIKEFSLLLFFLRHPDEALSRSDIFRQVWDEPFDGHTNTLDVYIFRLRRKLEANGPRLIHTVRGYGFRFGEA